MRPISTAWRKPRGMRIVGAAEGLLHRLLFPGERKSVEPMAARLAPDNVRRMHQSLHHVVADAPWSDEAVLRQVRKYVLPRNDSSRAGGGLDGG